MKNRMAIACIVLAALILLVGGAIAFFLFQDQEAAMEAEPMATSFATDIYSNSDPATPDPATLTPEPAPSASSDSNSEDSLLEVLPHDQQIRNILLYHSTGNPPSDSSQDHFLILTLDRSRKTLTLTALAPESFLQVRGFRSLYWDQLRGAYVHNGLNRLINTINARENFALDLQDSIGTDRDRFASLIDTLGGLSLSLSQEDCFLINWKYADIPADASKATRLTRLEEQEKPALQERDGDQLLNGQQVICYLEGDPAAGSDGTSQEIYKRMERMQSVLIRLYEQIRNTTELSGLVSLVQTLQNHTDTTLSQDTLIDLGAFLLSTDLEIVTLSLPRESSSKYAEEPIDDEGSVFCTLHFDMEAERAILWEALYDAPYGEVSYEIN